MSTPLSNEPKLGQKPAHPAIEIRYSTGPAPASTTKVYHTGLTKRELFAAMAMQGMLANHDIGVEPGGKYFAETAVKQADALLTALDRSQP
jgi:hypothetical protein